MTSLLGRLIFLTLLPTLASCAGVDIQAFKPKGDKSPDPFSDVTSGSQKGYLVYHPKIMFEVIDKPICVANDKDGNCQVPGYVCGLGTKLILPDYRRPYLVTIRNGFGKAGVDLTFAEGWRLEGLKDSSDNTALLEVIAKAAGLGAFKPSTVQINGQEFKQCESKGLYEWNGSELGSYEDRNGTAVWVPLKL
jgi:hypothetical protein